MNSFHLQVATPDGSYFDGEAVRVRLRSIAGDVAIMANHIPYVTAIGTGECRIVLPDEKERSAACAGGLLSVSRDTVRVVANTFEWAEEIDVERAKASQSRTTARLQETEDKALLASLKDKLARAETRLRVAEMAKNQG